MILSLLWSETKASKPVQKMVEVREFLSTLATKNLQVIMFAAIAISPRVQRKSSLTRKALIKEVRARMRNNAATRERQRMRTDWNCCSAYLMHG